MSDTKRKLEQYTDAYKLHLEESVDKFAKQPTKDQVEICAFGVTALHKGKLYSAIRHPGDSKQFEQVTGLPEWKDILNSRK